VRIIILAWQGMAVTFRELIDELLDAGRQPRHNIES
jgi:hypothetical protein